MDRFKQYLQEHKDELDIEVTKESAWESIRQQISSNPKKNVFVMYAKCWVAACVILLVSSGIFYFSIGNQISQTKIKPVAAKDTYSPVYKEPKEELATLASPKSITKKNIIQAQKPMRKNNSHKTDSLTEMILNQIRDTYNPVINVQLKQVRDLPLLAEGSSYFEYFKNQLNELDRDENNIFKTIKYEGPKNDFLQHLINIYQQKIFLLQRLQLEITKMNNHILQGERPTDTTEHHYLNI
jgi:hypothetical protein